MPVSVRLLAGSGIDWLGEVFSAVPHRLEADARTRASPVHEGVVPIGQFVSARRNCMGRRSGEEMFGRTGRTLPGRRTLRPCDW